MAITKQIATILNDSVKNALGTSATITEIDTSTVVTLGKVIEEYNLYEGFYKQLVNRIAQVVYFIRKYKGKNRSVLWDEHEYGAFVQRVYYKMPDTVDDAAFDIPDPITSAYKQASPFDIEQVVEATALIFGGQGTWSVEIIRPIEQIKTAFLNESEMMSFIDGIYMAIENRYEMDIENLCSLAVNTSMANSIKNGLSRNLLEEFNEGLETKLTVAQALKNTDFLKYATREIKNCIEFMGRFSTVFNGARYETFTPPDRMVVEMLAHFTSAYDTYLQADTFHDEITALPNFEKITFWQGSGKKFDFKTCSSIDIVNDQFKTESDEIGAVKQSGVICFIHDIENVACMFGNRTTWEMFNPRSDVMIHGEKARKGFAVDSHANSFVFYMA